MNGPLDFICWVIDRAIVDCIFLFQILQKNFLEFNNLPLKHDMETLKRTNFDKTLENLFYLKTLHYRIQ